MAPFDSKPKMAPQAFYLRSFFFVSAIIFSWAVSGGTVTKQYPTNSSPWCMDWPCLAITIHQQQEGSRGDHAGDHAGDLWGFGVAEDLVQQHLGCLCSRPTNCDGKKMQRCMASELQMCLICVDPDMLWVFAANVRSKYGAVFLGLEDPNMVKWSLNMCMPENLDVYYLPKGVGHESYCYTCHIIAPWLKGPYKSAQGPWYGVGLSAQRWHMGRPCQEWLDFGALGVLQAWDRNGASLGIARCQWWCLGLASTLLGPGIQDIHVIDTSLWLAAIDCVCESIQHAQRT